MHCRVSTSLLSRPARAPLTSFFHRLSPPKTLTAATTTTTTTNQMAPPIIVVEYAKSGRSTCKNCSKPIPAKSMRLGLVSRDSRGFDLTKWHHLDCFRGTIDSAESVTGFASLQSSDQEALKRLVGKCNSDKSVEKVSNESNDAMEGSEKLSTKSKRGDTQEIETEDAKLKKTKLFTPIEEAEMDIAFSLTDIADNYKDAKLLPKWKSYRTVIFRERDDGLQDSEKIAAFDFDGCLAKTSVKRVGADAWSLMYPSIPEKLQSLHSDGYKLVIFTNESNIERWKNKRQAAVDSKIGRLNNFIELVKVPVQVFIACGYDGKVEDPFRKPKPGLWHLLERHFNSDIPIDMDKSFYVGDAAGRDGDHSDADIKFAQAIGLKFHVPEDFFGG